MALLVGAETQYIGDIYINYISLNGALPNIVITWQRGALMSEPAILARNSDDKTEVFSMEDFESKLVSMRELYQEHKNEGMFHNKTENPLALFGYSQA